MARKPWVGNPLEKGARHEVMSSSQVQRASDVVAGTFRLYFEGQWTQEGCEMAGNMVFQQRFGPLEARDEAMASPSCGLRCRFR